MYTESGRHPSGIEAARPPANVEMNELTSNWESHLTHVYANPETAGLLRSLIRKAKKEFPEERGWLQTMRDVKASLENTDDEDEVRQILTEALGGAEAARLDDEDDEDPTELEEDEV